jgi:trehalose 6-phosphate phosphatase
MTSTAPLREVLRRLAETPRLLVCCDFDGTLSHLADQPAAARPVPGAVAVLEALGGLPDTWAAVISGRELAVLTPLAAMPPHVQLVGSHGTEFEPGVITGLGPAERRLLSDVVEACAAIAAETPGTLIESKPASVAVHVRNVSRDQADGVLAMIRSGPGSTPGVHAIEGKEVVELGVVRGGKDGAVNELRSRWAATASMFVGDDVTDEAAFAALSEGDVGVKVGAGDTRAGWRVGDPDEVVRLLSDLLALRRTATVTGSVRDTG